MKKLIGIILICMAASCQKADLVEINQGKQGRSETEEQTDSVRVTPQFDTESWEGAIDATFTF